MAALALASPALADIPEGVPDILSADPVVRGALVAMPAVWQVRVTEHLTGLRQKDGTVLRLTGGARTVTKEGTAFSVTPDGDLLTAGHSARPPARDIAQVAYLEQLALTGQPHSEQIAADWVARTGAVPMRQGAIEQVVRPASAGPAARTARAHAFDVITEDTTRDIAVLRVQGVRDTPSISLDRGHDAGTPVANLGFGTSDPFAQPQHGALVPSVRTGVITDTGRPNGERNRILSLITNPIQLGDSGGPVVDSDGRARGMVLLRDKQGGGAMAPTDELLRVLDTAGIHPWEGRTTRWFRDALTAARSYQLPTARAALRNVLRSYPAQGLAAYELQQVDQLATAQVALAPEPRYRGGLLVVGITALVVAGLLAVLLWKAVNRMPGVLGPRDRKAPFDQDDAHLDDDQGDFPTP